MDSTASTAGPRHRDRPQDRRPDLSVWVITGDGDSLSIGGNHLMHAIRRNLDIKILLFNNQIYGLTKGQYSPTSPFGPKEDQVSPFGSVDTPVSSARALPWGRKPRSWPARWMSTSSTSTYVLDRAHAHKGTAFVEIYQDCNVFNSGAFEYASERSSESDNVVYLEHGKPLVFGKGGKKGIRLNNMKPEVVEIGKGANVDDLLFHDEKATDTRDHWPFCSIARMMYPDLPSPIGVLRAVEKPTYDDMVNRQIEDVIAKRGKGDLKKLIAGDSTWEVKA